MNPLVTGQIQAILEQAIVSLVALLPDLIVALVLVAIGVFVGNRIGPVVSRAGRRIELDEKVNRTAFGPLFPDREGAAADALGVFVKWYIVLFALVEAFNILGLEQAQHWVDVAIGYLPALLAGLVIIVVGILVADYFAEIVRRSTVAEDLGRPNAVAGLTKAALYFFVIVIGLDTMGVSVGVVYVFLDGLAFGIGLALAIAVVFAIAWTLKDPIADFFEERSGS